jgi:hypothetical protein
MREETMESVATYSETRFSGQRDFTLYADRIRVTGKVFLKSDFDTTIQLARLNPDYSRLRVRETGFMSGVCLILISLLLTGILIAGFKLPVEHPLVLLVIIQPVAGLVLCLATLRKVDFARFQNDDGIVVLDVARAGKSKSGFDPFIEALADTIRKSKEVAEQHGGRISSQGAPGAPSNESSP